MAWVINDDSLAELVDVLEEWAAITSMANHLARKIPVGVATDIEATGGPAEMWRIGIAMAALSTEARCEITETIGRLLLVVRNQLDPSGVSSRRGVLRVASSSA